MRTYLVLKSFSYTTASGFRSKAVANEVVEMDENHASSLIDQGLIRETKPAGTRPLTLHEIKITGPSEHKG